MKIKILSRWSSAAVFSVEASSLYLALEAAVLRGANLRGADLRALIAPPRSTRAAAASRARRPGDRRSVRRPR